MRKNQLSNMFQEDIKRNNKISRYICIILILFAIFLSFIILYIDYNKVEYVKYSEKGNIEYKVYLKENDFFENDYLEENNQYISTLIDDIQSNFKYNLSLEEENVTYKYTYKIVANVKVTDKATKRNLYNKDEILVAEKEEITKEKSIDINEDVTIDYNKYNDLMKSFINIYEVGNIESNLTVSMYVDVVGSCENFQNDSKNESVMTLTIPLTTSTMAIDIKNDLIDTNNNVIICQEKSKINLVFLALAIVSFITDALVAADFVSYVRKTRSAKTKYEKEIKKILNNYRQYIQKVDNTVKFENYQEINVSTFTDLLEIRDTVQEPILMIEEKKITKFIIPTNNIVYTYIVKIEEKK